MADSATETAGGKLIRTGSSVLRFIKRVMRYIGNVQARIILAVFYFLVLAPFALFVRWTQDPLALKPGTRKGWRPRETADDPASRAAKQF